MPMKNEMKLDIDIDDSKNPEHDWVSEIKFVTSGREDELKEVYEKICTSANLGDQQNECITTLPELPMAYPRGRHTVQIQRLNLKFQGKTNDFKVAIKNVRTMQILPKPDEKHQALVLELTNPVIIGKTNYPFLAFNFDREVNEDPIKMNAKLAAKIFGTDRDFKDIYDRELYKNVRDVFKSVIKCRTVRPENFESSNGSNKPKNKDDNEESQKVQCIACTQKTNEGQMYPLEKSFIFITKPVVLIKNEDIRYVKLARMNRTYDTRTFELVFMVRKGEQIFQNIDKTEQDALFDWLQTKKIRISNMQEESDGEGGSQKAARKKEEQQMDDDDEEEDEDYNEDDDDGEEESQSDEDDEEMAPLVPEEPQKKRKRQD